MRASTSSPRGVIGGAVLLAVGAAFLLPPLGVPDAGAYLFVALGLAFGAAWWLGSKQFVYLVPAGVLIGFGLGLVLPSLFDLPAETAGPVFLGTLALGQGGSAHDRREARTSESRRLRQGPHRPTDDRGRGTPRPFATGGRHRRANEREHRRRSRDGRGDQGISPHLHDGRQAKPGKA